MLLALLLASSASAHDYWLFPKTFTPDAGSDMRMLLLVGDDGDIEQIRPFEKERTPRLELWTAAGRADLLPDHPRRANPAVQTPAPATPGLALLTLDRAAAEVVLDPETFAHHLESEGLTHLVHEHDGHAHVHGPQTDTFDRSLKVLLAVDGDSSGTVWSQVVGQTLEIVLHSNPFDGPGPLGLTVLQDGEPVRNVKVEAVQRLGKAATPAVLADQTDRKGHATFTLTPGRWTLRATTAEAAGRDAWTSHWAAFSIQVPEAE
ncbi:MAG: putative GH25 family protein [Myxococcota bacterium]|jgi:uncharacterized GH25 family protein